MKRGRAKKRNRPKKEGVIVFFCLLEGNGLFDEKGAKLGTLTEGR